MIINNEDELLDLFRRLQERLQQADGENTKGSHNTIVYVATGATYVNNQHNQNFQSDPPRKRESPTGGETASPSFDPDTPLSALFRENHHNELRQIIDSWRPYLVDDETDTEALVLSHFEFDKDRIYSNKVYRDLCGLDVAGALKVPLSQLAHYLTGHSNLSRSYATLYQQLKYYRSEWT